MHRTVAVVLFAFAVFGCRSAAPLRADVASESDPPRSLTCDDVRNNAARAIDAYLDQHADASFITLDHLVVLLSIKMWRDDGSPPSSRGEIASYVEDYNRNARAYNARAKENGGLFTTPDCLPSGTSETIPAEFSLIAFE